MRFGYLDIFNNEKKKNQLQLQFIVSFKLYIFTKYRSPD